MLTITVPETELFNEVTGEFTLIKQQTLQLEHSLLSISKWEAKWNKPFLSKDSKTVEQKLDYVRCMCITQNVNPDTFKAISNENYQKISEYINAPMTATTFSDKKKKINREIITNEIIYYWMVAYQIPFECQKWHLNHLLTLIDVCNIKNAPSKNMSKKSIMKQNAALNAARRKHYGSRG